jgi:hypothetical protein
LNWIEEVSSLKGNFSDKAPIQRNSEPAPTDNFDARMHLTLSDAPAFYDPPLQLVPDSNLLVNKRQHKTQAQTEKEIDT